MQGVRLALSILCKSSVARSLGSRPRTIALLQPQFLEFGIEYATYVAVVRVFLGVVLMVGLGGVEDVECFDVGGDGFACFGFVGFEAGFDGRLLGFGLVE